MKQYKIQNRSQKNYHSCVQVNFETFVSSKMVNKCGKSHNSLKFFSHFLSNLFINFSSILNLCKMNRRTVTMLIFINKKNYQVILAFKVLHNVISNSSVHDNV